MSVTLPELREEAAASEKRIVNVGRQAGQLNEELKNRPRGGDLQGLGEAVGRIERQMEELTIISENLGAVRDHVGMWNGTHRFRLQGPRGSGKVPEGGVTTYGHLAAMAGSPGAGLAVGKALNELPINTKVPWWRRVVDRSGRIKTGGRTATWQAFLLESEGVQVRLGRVRRGGPGTSGSSAVRWTRRPPAWYGSVRMKCRTPP